MLAGFMLMKKKTKNVYLHLVTGKCVCSGLQGEGRLMNHNVSFGGGGPHGLSGRWSCDSTTLTATVGQQAQLFTQCLSSETQQSQ